MYDDGLPVLGADDLVDVQRAALPLDVLLQLQLAAHQSPLLLLRAGRRLAQSESAERETHTMTRWRRLKTSLNNSLHQPILEEVTIFILGIRNVMDLLRNPSKSDIDNIGKTNYKKN